MSDETSELNGGKPKGVPFVRKRGDGANGELRHWWQYGEHGYVARYDYADGSKETIPYFRWEDDKWKPGGPKTPSPLFGLESIQDQSPNTTIYVCEGEKATAALHALKLPAVTSQGGSQAAHKADWSPLADVQRIVLLPDHDEAGEKYADSVLGRLANFGYQGEAFISRLPDLPEHGDVVEWIKKRACLWDEYGPIPLNPGDGLVDELLSEIEDHSELAKLATLALAIRENEKTAILSDGSEEEYEDYPIDALGDLLGSAARGLQEGVQAPDALCAQSVLAAASLAVQAHANVVIDGRVIPLSLFHLTVGESGERKSTLDTAALRPHREYQKDLFSQYKIALETHRKDEAAFKKTETQVLTKYKTLKDRRIQLDALGDSPTPPLIPIVVLDDLTIEGVLKQLQLGLPTLGIFSDEGGKVAGGHAMNSDNQLKTVSSLSNLWDGKPTTRVRSGDGATLLYGKRVALHLMMQPSVAALLVNNDLLRDQGFLSRCLTAWPKSTTGTRMYKEIDLFDTVAMRRYEARITDILYKPLPLRQDCCNELEPRSLNLTADAKKIWIGFHDHVEVQLTDDEKLGPIRGFASKAPEHAVRLAGVLTLVNDIEAYDIDCAEMDAGISLMNFYLAEALRIRESAEVDPAVQHASKIYQWIQQKAVQLIDMKELLQLGPRPRKAQEIRSAMASLVDMGRAEVVEPQKVWKIL